MAEELSRRWELPKAKKKFAGELTEGRTGPGGPRVAVLKPQTFMNDSGRSVGPARGSYKLDLDRILVVHDEIDLAFGDIRVKEGGGLAGHNGLRSLKRELGGAEFWRVRVGVVTSRRWRHRPVAPTSPASHRSPRAPSSSSVASQRRSSRRS